MLRRLRFRLVRLLLGELPQSHMVPLCRSEYLYVDYYRQVWRLKPTGDPQMPLIILAQER